MLHEISFTSKSPLNPYVLIAFGAACQPGTIKYQAVSLHGLMVNRHRYFLLPWFSSVSCPAFQFYIIK